MGVASLVSKIDCISRTNRLNELILHAVANSGKLKVISLIFEWAWSKIDVAIYLVHETLKSTVS